MPGSRDVVAKERLLGDIRRGTEMPCGGDFAAFEEPELLANDVIEFLAELETQARG